LSRDVAAGQAPELDAIAGPILRGGNEHRVEVSATRALADHIARAINGTRAVKVKLLFTTFVGPVLSRSVEQIFRADGERLLAKAGAVRR
jgi:hypothetical protein